MVRDHSVDKRPIRERGLGRRGGIVAGGESDGEAKGRQQGYQAGTVHHLTS